jgi:cytochrome c-type biogenesis protein CcmH/NrfF
MRTILAVALVALAAPALAQSEGDRAAQISRRVMSPFCPGKTLYDCPSPLASGWRSDIHEWVDEGVEDEAIVSRLQDRVPGFELQRPAPSGMLQIFAGAALLLVAGVFLLLGRALTGRKTASTPPPLPEEDPPLDARLERELARLDS